MEYVQFLCKAALPQSPQEIAKEILDLSNWVNFKGYGPLPGIASAKFEVQTPEIVGTRIRVHNTDGSQHIEEIVEWNPESTLALRMQEFSPPLSKLATHIDETWEFETLENGTHVKRRFQMHARNAVTIPILWLMSMFLERAVDKHLKQLANR